MRLNWEKTNFSRLRALWYFLCDNFIYMTVYFLTLEPSSGVPRHPIQSARYGNFADFLGFFFIFIKLSNIYWKINIILLLPLFSTLKNEENGLPKNCYTTNRKHCATIQVWGVVEPQWTVRGWASSVDGSRVNYITKNKLHDFV